MRIFYGATIVATSLGLSSSALADQVIEFWTPDAEGQFSYVMAAEFMAQNPDITINLKTVNFNDMVTDLQRAVATGQAPDMSYVDNPDTVLFSSAGVLTDLTPYFENSSIVDAADIFPGPLQSVSWEGGIYGIPRGSNTIALFYNADMFRANGLDPDMPPQTWDELYEAAKALNDPENDVYGLAFAAVASEEGTFQFLPFLQAAGGSYDQIGGEPGEMALSYWTRFLDEGLVSQDALIRGQWDATGTFNSQNTAMSISGPWELPRMSEDADFDFRVAVLPAATEGGPRASALGEGNHVIFEGSENADAAFQFMEYMYSQMPRVWNEFGYLPASQVEVENPNWPEAYQVFVDQMAWARSRGPHPQWAQISKAHQDAIQNALTGRMSAEEAAATAQSQIDAILE